MVFVSVNVKMIRVCGGDNCYIWVKVVERPVVFVCLDDRQRRLFVQDKIAPRVSEYSPRRLCIRIGLRRMLAIIDDVVVFPCEPATQMASVSAVILPRSAARFITSNPLLLKNVRILFDSGLQVYTLPAWFPDYGNLPEFHLQSR